MTEPRPRLCRHCREPEPTRPGMTPATQSLFPFVTASFSIRPKRASNIIGLIGAAGAGKDAFQKALAWNGINCTRLAFADPLKLEVAAVLGVSLSEIEKNKPRYRLMLQWWGTEWRRHDNDNYWLDRMDEAVSLVPAERLAVLTDVRFPNEAKFVRERGGQIIRIVRPDSTKLTGAAAAHSSENVLTDLPADLTVLNEGNLTNLRETAGDIARYLNFPTN